MGDCEACVLQIVKLKAVPLWGWDSDRYLNGGGVGDEGMIMTCGTALKSEFWWLCMSGLDLLAGCLLEANMWARSCPCHGPSLATC